MQPILPGVANTLPPRKTYPFGATARHLHGEHSIGIDHPLHQHLAAVGSVALTENKTRGNAWAAISGKATTALRSPPGRDAPDCAGDVDRKTRRESSRRRPCSSSRVRQCTVGHPHLRIVVHHEHPYQLCQVDAYAAASGNDMMRSVMRPRPPCLAACVCGKPHKTTWFSHGG